MYYVIKGEKLKPHTHSKWNAKNPILTQTLILQLIMNDPNPSLYINTELYLNRYSILNPHLKTKFNPNDYN